MGINNLKKFIREKFPDLIHNSNIKIFNGKKICIDISSYIYKYKVIFGEEWLNAFINFICALKRFNIHGCFIFDGKAPPEKDKEREERQKQKDKNEENIMNISLELDIYKSTNISTPLLLTIMDKINKKLKDNNKKINKLLYKNGKSNDNKGEINIEKIEEYIKKKESQIVNIIKDEIDTCKKIIELFGAQYIQAPGEAEALASYLNIQGISDATISEDTDVMTYGSNIFISNLNSSTGECEIIYIKEVLEELEMTQKEFLDFCIMCGTDYNNNIPQYGCAKVFKIINKYRTIDNFIEEEDKKVKPLDYKILNHKRSRELFETFGDMIKIKLPLDDMIKNEVSSCKDEENKISCKYKILYWDTMVDFDILFEYLSKNGCKFYAKTIKQLWDPPELIFEEEEKEED